jgi:hypothetical protein
VLASSSCAKESLTFRWSEWRRAPVGRLGRLVSAAIAHLTVRPHEHVADTASCLPGDRSWVLLLHHALLPATGRPASRPSKGFDLRKRAGTQASAFLSSDRCGRNSRLATHVGFCAVPVGRVCLAAGARKERTLMILRSNPPAGGNARAALQFANERHWPYVPQPGR